ncbi:hypothetical protein ACNKHU_00045 [Shigella flexneri]
MSRNPEQVSPGDNRLVGGCADVRRDIIRAERLRRLTSCRKRNALMTDKFASFVSLPPSSPTLGTSRQ